MRYYFGPWQWVTDGGRSFWQPPAGFSGLDLRTLPQMAQQGGPAGVGLFFGLGEIADSNYLLAGEGSIYEIRPTQTFLDALPRRTGYAPQGADLIGVLLDLLTSGADPTGQECSKPLFPGTRGRLALHLGGQKHFHRFRWSRGHFSHVRDVLRADLKRTILEARAEAAELRALATAINGQTWAQVATNTDPVVVRNRKLLLWLRNTKGLTVAQSVTALGNRADRIEHHYRKVLDFSLEKYGINKAGWQELCPQDMLGELEPPEPHETTITESFNTSDSDIMGADLTWTEISGDWDNESNRGIKNNNATTVQFARAESDLSSDDHYSEAEVYFATALGGAGPCARFSGSAATCYSAQHYDTLLYLTKFVAAAQTNLASDTNTWSSGSVTKMENDGSALKGYYGGVEQVSVTDTSITGNTRSGLISYERFVSFDLFEAADLGGGGGGILYTQLERNIRGYGRGSYAGGVS